MITLNSAAVMKMLLMHVMLLFAQAMQMQFIQKTCESSQLALSVSNIIRVSFSPANSLLISSSENDQCTVHTLLKDLHRFARWNLQVSQPISAKLKPKYQQKEKVQSYIIFTRGSDDVMAQMDNLMNTTAWNNQARFLVAVTRYTASPEHLALKIVQLLWDTDNVLNTVVLLENDTGFQLYTWFPYQSHRECGAVSKVKLIEVLNKNGNINNKTIFPYKVPKNFLGCPIRISIAYKHHNTGAMLLTNFLLRSNFTMLQQRNFSENVESFDRARDAYQDFIFDLSDIAGFFALEYGHPSPQIDFYYYAWHVPCAKPLHRIQKIATIFSFPLWMALVSVTVSVSVMM
jgi:hypothetical protein